jgi:hypothetical protein
MSTDLGSSDIGGGVEVDPGAQTKQKLCGYLSPTGVTRAVSNATPMELGIAKLGYNLTCK